jgi:hypothetical protein
MSYINRNELIALISGAPIEPPAWFVYRNNIHFTRIKDFERQNEIGLLKTDCEEGLKKELKNLKMEYEKRKYLAWRIYYAKELLNLLKEENDLFN